MKHTLMSLLVFLVLMAFDKVIAGPFTAKKDNACPDSWQLTTVAIPVISKSLGATSSYPYKAGTNNTDKSKVLTHLNAANPIVTIDGTELTELKIEDDLLTIASECLRYRNLEAGTYDYVAPVAGPPNVATGWVPAAIF